MKPLPKNYDHQAREKYWQKHWVDAGTYHFKNDKSRAETFVIDTPPPTVSGLLHMGHIFSYTQADFVARYQRMSGKDVFYPMGFDDNGLPTERLVEKEKKIRATDYIKEHGREGFIALCKEVVVSAEEEFRKLFKSTALSVDWRTEYQTVNEDVRKLSQTSFLDLLKKGEAYRDFRPTYWDWVDQTAIAQAEIENKEMPGTMNEIEFTLEDGSPLVIMTTRPELLGACVAVMYHPDDANAEKYKGKHAITPLFGVKVPMIADEAVEREKGTGIVMCCTFGDDTDKEWWRKYNLPTRPILAKDGRIFYGNRKDDQKIVEINFRFHGGRDGEIYSSALNKENCLNIVKTYSIFEQIITLKPKQANAKIIELLQSHGKLLNPGPIGQAVPIGVERLAAAVLYDLVVADQQVPVVQVAKIDAQLAVQAGLELFGGGLVVSILATIEVQSIKGTVLQQLADQLGRRNFLVVVGGTRASIRIDQDNFTAERRQFGEFSPKAAGFRVSGGGDAGARRRNLAQPLRVARSARFGKSALAVFQKQMLEPVEPRKQVVPEVARKNLVPLALIEGFQDATDQSLNCLRPPSTIDIVQFAGNFIVQDTLQHLCPLNLNGLAQAH